MDVSFFMATLAERSGVQWTLGYPPKYMMKGQRFRSSALKTRVVPNE